MSRETHALPPEGDVVTVLHEYGTDSGIVRGVMPGRTRGTYRERQPALILENGECVAHIPVETIQAVRPVNAARRPEGRRARASFGN